MKRLNGIKSKLFCFNWYWCNCWRSNNCDDDGGGAENERVRLNIFAVEQKNESNLIEDCDNSIFH